MPRGSVVAGNPDLRERGNIGHPVVDGQSGDPFADHGKVAGPEDRPVGMGCRERATGVDDGQRFRRIVVRIAGRAHCLQRAHHGPAAVDRSRYSSAKISTEGP